ncbi:MAG: helix-turn-helix domain-containing protein [Alphaproteobacteria bacterium]
MTDTHTPRPFGDMLRGWRQRRRLSQLDLALEAGVSARHVSFVETGRAKPSRDMVLLLAEQLEVPLRDRNTLLMAAGFAPVYRERDLDDPSLRPVRDVVDLVLRGHSPYPALAVDRHWRMVAANAAVGLLTEGSAPGLLQPPVNARRVGLHPDGMAPRIANLGQWRTHILARLRRQVDVTADPVLAELEAELRGYPAPADGEAVAIPGDTDIVVPLRLRRHDDVLSFISTTTVFGTPADVTLDELAIESFFPADEATAAALRAAAAQ